MPGRQHRRLLFYVQGRPAALRPQLPRRAIYRVSPPEPLPEGSHRLRFEFEPTGEPDIPSGQGSPGRAQLYVDDRLVGARPRCR